MAKEISLEEFIREELKEKVDAGVNIFHKNNETLAGVWVETISKGYNPDVRDFYFKYLDVRDEFKENEKR